MRSMNRIDCVTFKLQSSCTNGHVFQRLVSIHINVVYLEETPGITARIQLSPKIVSGKFGVVYYLCNLSCSKRSKPKLSFVPSDALF